MTPFSPACTRRQRSWRARPWRRPGRSGPARRSTARASRAGCTMRCAGRRAVSAFTTTRRSRSPGSSGPARPAGTRDAGWLRAFHAVVPPLLRAFQPSILVSQHGCDTHWLDPLAGLQLSIDAQRAAHAAIHGLAHQVAGGRWLLTGGGGYELLQVVPRTWTHLLAEAAGRPIDPAAAIPAAWREYAAGRTGRQPPELMTEGARPQYASFESGYDPEEPVDQAIMATRSAV